MTSVLDADHRGPVFNICSILYLDTSNTDRRADNKVAPVFLNKHRVTKTDAGVQIAL
jgi:hypothetical protein